MSLLFNMLSRFVVSFLPKQASFNFMALPQEFWNPRKFKSVTVSIVSPSICDEVMGPMP